MITSALNNPVGSCSRLRHHNIHICALKKKIIMHMSEYILVCFVYIIYNYTRQYIWCISVLIVLSQLNSGSMIIWAIWSLKIIIMLLAYYWQKYSQLVISELEMHFPAVLDYSCMGYARNHALHDLQIFSLNLKMLQWMTDLTQFSVWIIYIVIYKDAVIWYTMHGNHIHIQQVILNLIWIKAMQ